jgi:hypothetical protein
MMESLIALLLGLALLNGMFYVAQPSMTFYPMRAIETTPAAWGLAYEDVSFAAADGTRLHGWFIPAPGAQATLLFFHGNAGNISHRGDSIAIFHRRGWNVFIFDYRGYGKSDGTPDEEGLSADGAGAWRYLTETRGIAPRDITIFGRSLGAAVAVKQAADAPPAALILESTFSSARDFAHRVFPILSRLVWLRYDFDSAARIKQVTCPLLVLHSPEDEIMPFALGEKLFAAANEPKQFVRLRGDHNSGFLLSQPGYEQALAQFKARLISGATKN